ncbi:MAG TPA: diacylglycerol kinase [Patescibacteria group bacterium]|nr:diacylglycerol kinase [Patescibacteria group bacterium]
MPVFSLRNQYNSFCSAARGLRYIFKSELNFRIQILISIAVLVPALYFPLRSWELILLILLIVAVLIMEILNTTFEYLSDLLKPRLHHYVQIIKDIMAGAVLLTSLGAAIIGILIFYPHFMTLLK